MSESPFHNTRHPVQRHKTALHHHTESSSFNQSAMEKIATSRAPPGTTIPHTFRIAPSKKESIKWDNNNFGNVMEHVSGTVLNPQYLMYASTYALVLDIIHQQCIIYVYIAEGPISLQGGIIKDLKLKLNCIITHLHGYKETELNDILPLLPHDFCYTIHVFQPHINVHRYKHLRLSIHALRTADCGLRTTYCELQTADCGLRTVDCGLWTADCELWTVHCGLQTTYCGLCPQC